MDRPSQPVFLQRTRARLAAIQALFQIEQTGEMSSTVVIEFLEHRLGDQKRFVNTTFFAKLTEGAWAQRAQTDALISGALKEGWDISRLESVSRAILRVALFELQETDIPTAVIINEYLNIAHSFFDETEVAFVNGVLNTLSKKIRSE